MSPDQIPVAVFRLGRIVATQNALQSIPNEDILKAIQRHQAGDWGDLDSEDRNSNDRALTSGGRLFSAYHARDGTKFWIITEADRSVTTIEPKASLSRGDAIFFRQRRLCFRSEMKCRPRFQ